MPLLAENRIPNTPPPPSSPLVQAVAAGDLATACIASSMHQ